MPAPMLCFLHHRRQYFFLCCDKQLRMKDPTLPTQGGKVIEFTLQFAAKAQITKYAICMWRHPSGAQLANAYQMWQDSLCRGPLHTQLPTCKAAYLQKAGHQYERKQHQAPEVDGPHGTCRYTTCVRRLLQHAVFSLASQCIPMNWRAHSTLSARAHNNRE